MRPTKYSCSNCTFSGTTISIWGHHLYVHEGKEVPVNAYPGICYDCNGISPVEKLPTNQSLKNLEGKYKEIRGYRVPLEHHYEEETLRLELLENRKTPPKCLKCGGTDIVPFTDSVIEDGLQHRGCGGIITHETQEYSLNMGQMSTTYYDVEGTKIR